MYLRYVQSGIYTKEVGAPDSVQHEDISVASHCGMFDADMLGSDADATDTRTNAPHRCTSISQHR